MNTEDIRELFSDAVSSAYTFFTQDVRDFLKEASTGRLIGTEQIFFQLREMFIMAVCGACVAFLFEVYASTPAGRKAEKSPSLLTHVFDFFFCVAAGLISARFLYISSYGQISAHEAAAFAAGLFSGRAVFTFKKSKAVGCIAFLYVIMLVMAYIIMV